MCKHGSSILFKLFVQSASRENLLEQKNVAIDSCILDLIKALNKNNIHTIASCCGHGKVNGNIALRDGRELIIAKDFKEARKLEKSISN